MLRDFSGSALAAGLLAAFVGVSSSFAIILRGLSAVGASPAQAASGLMALSISMGLCAIYLSVKSKMPISIAWSTPGAALLASSVVPEGGFGVAVGSFLACGVLIVVAGLWKLLGRAVENIPAPLANAMLAGVLFNLCLAPAKAVGQVPALALPVIIVWALVAKFRRLYAVPAAVVMAVALILMFVPGQPFDPASLWPAPVVVMPQFSLQSVIGIAVPLFIVTMASQNIPGMAVLNVNGYRPEAGPLFTATGIFSLLSAPFGGYAVNLAAITAALCAGPDAHPDPSRRYWSAVVAGLAYIVFGLAAGAVTSLISAAPPVLIEAVAGLALLGAMGVSLRNAVVETQDREAAAITFLVAASGLTFFGISGAFWGLLAGGAVMALGRWRV